MNLTLDNFRDAWKEDPTKQRPKGEEEEEVQVGEEVEDEEVEAERKAAAMEAAEGDEAGEEGEKEEGEELSLEERIAALKAEMKEEMLGDAAEGKKAPAPGEVEEEEAGVQRKEPPNFLREDDDIEAITESRENLNKFAQRIYQEAVKDVQEGFKKEMTDLRAQLGPFVEQQVQSGIATREAIKEFHDQNADLRKYPKTVMKVANELAAENPKWGLNEIMNQLGDATRERLGINSKATSPQKGKGDPSEEEGKKKPPVSFKGKSATRRTPQKDKGDGNDKVSQYERMKRAKGNLLFAHGQAE